MENNSEKETLPNLQTVLDAVNVLRGEISALHSEVNARFDKIEAQLMNVETDVGQVKTNLEQIKEMQFVFENELDRILAAMNHSLSLSYENRPNIRIMRKKIETWAQGNKNLERKVA